MPLSANSKLGHHLFEAHVHMCEKSAEVVNYWNIAI